MWTLRYIWSLTAQTFYMSYYLLVNLRMTKHLFDSEEKKVDLEFSRTRRQWVCSHNQSYLERMVNAPREWMNPEIISEFVWLHSASPQEYNDFNHLRGSVCFQRLKTCDPIDDPKAAQCCQLREEESSRQGLFFHCVIKESPTVTLRLSSFLPLPHS